MFAPLKVHVVAFIKVGANAQKVSKTLKGILFSFLGTIRKMKYLRSCREPNGILAKRKIGNSIQYFVKLPNQTDEQCSWIDQDYLHIDKFIEEFEKTKKIHIDFDLNKRDQIENQMAHRDSIQQQLIDLINSNSFMTKLRVDRVITAVRHHKQVYFSIPFLNFAHCHFQSFPSNLRFCIW